MQSSTMPPKRLPARWLDMFRDSSLSTAPWPLSFITADVSWSILASVSSSAQAICLQVSRSALACSGVVPGLVQDVVLEKSEQPASSAAMANAVRMRIDKAPNRFEIRRYLAGNASKLQQWARLSSSGDRCADFCHFRGGPPAPSGGQSIWR